MNKFSIKKVLGEGSYGTVYLVEDDQKNISALKRINVDPFKTEESLMQIEVMQKFIHPNLVRIDGYEVVDNGQKIQIIMQYCEGGDLLNYFKKKDRNLTVQEILLIFRQIVKAFISLNIKGVMHRDLKPENVLMKNDMTVKIADFGCARSVSLNEISKVNNFSLDKGTPLYSSPELLMNASYSAKCDVWSVGSLLYFIYFKQHPFLDSSVHNSLKRIQNLTQQKTIKLPADCDPTIRSLIQATLVYKDEERASWRQLWLSRYFCEKVGDVESFLNYLQSISNIANWMVKQFWRIRKTMEIQPIKSELFAYYTIKFQYTNAMLSYEIAAKNQAYEYLFEPGAYLSLTVDRQQKLIKEITGQLSSRREYYLSIKQKLKKQPCFIQIQAKSTKRKSMFADLDNSIKATNKILTSIHPQKSDSSSALENTTTELIWLMMARWMNFEFWFSYQNQPRIQDFLSDNNPSVLFNEILIEIDKYNYGVVE